MNRAARPARTATGRPLLALAGLVTCWIGARVAVWELPETPAVIENIPARLIELTTLPGLSAADRGLARIRIPTARSATAALARVTIAEVANRSPFDGAATFALPVPAPVQSMAFVAGVPGSIGVLAPPQSPAVQAVAVWSPPGPVRPLPARRWSADLWVALRERGGALFGGGASLPVYGASQAGAVLRYRLALASPHEPAAYGRVVQALGRREGDLAAGLAARLAPGSPIIAHVEARVSERGERVELRPAAFLTAGFHDRPFAFGLRARGYGQAGYVGGPDATAFADGNVIAEREIVQADNIVLAAGAGLWGGAQRGAARLDFGPSSSVSFTLGEGRVRLALDYRLRIAGNAEPASGAALTLSAGF